MFISRAKFEELWSDVSFTKAPGEWYFVNGVITKSKFPNGDLYLGYYLGEKVYLCPVRFTCFTERQL